MNKNLERDIVTAYFDAIAARDFARARRYLADRPFSTSSPISAFDSADDYIADISRVGPILERVELRKLFTDGNEACAIVNYVTHMDQRRSTRVVHWIRLTGDKICAIETIFDARDYAAMFAIESAPG